MKRPALVAVLIAALAAVGAAWHWWPAQGEPARLAVRAPAAPPAQPSAMPDSRPQWMDELAEQAPPEPQRVPLPPVDASMPAWLAMAEAREHGDARSPPVQHDEPVARATQEELANPQAYRRYEQGQHARLLSNFAEAAKDEIPRLRSDVERGRAAGVPDAELAKMEEKIRRIEALRAEVIQGPPGAP